MDFVNSDYPMSLENSFSNDGKGYMLSNGDINVGANDLKNVLYGMVERSMIRKVELQNGQQMTPEKRKALHDKIMADKEKREQEQQRQKEKENKKQYNNFTRMMNKL